MTAVQKSNSSGGHVSDSSAAALTGGKVIA